MSGYEKRLRGLEAIWPLPAPPTQRDRARWDWLTEEELEAYAEIRAAMSAVDVAPARLDERTEIRMRLDGLTDDQLERLEALQARIQRLSEEHTTP